MTVEQVKVIIKDGRGSLQHITAGVTETSRGGLEISEAKKIAKEKVYESTKIGRITVYGVTDLDLMERSRQARARMQSGSS